MEGLLKQSTAVNVTVLMIDGTAHILGKTGLTLTIYATKAGGTPTVITPTVTELDSTNAPGIYKLALTTTHTDTLGEFQLHVTSSGADPSDVKWQVCAGLPGDNVGTFAKLEAMIELAPGSPTYYRWNQPAAETVWDAARAAHAVTGSFGEGVASVQGAVTGAVASVTARVTANTDQLAGQTVTAGAGVTFPASVASPTNITAGTITTATNLTNAPSDSSGVTTLLSRLTSSRAGYLDNLNVGGAVASQADVQAINQSASRHIILSTVAQYEKPDSSTLAYEIEARTFNALTGAAVNADTTPTLTATGEISGSLSGNLSSASNPATGVYRWTYTVSSSDASEPIRMDVSATISSSVYTMACYTQVIVESSADFTATDKSNLTAIFDKLPSNNMADETLLAGLIAALPQDKNGYRLSATGVNDLLRTALTEGYAADGSPMTVEQALHMIWSLLAERNLAGTTLQTKQLDGSSNAMAFTLDDAVTPTSQTRSA